MSLKKRFFKTKDTCKVTFLLPQEAVEGAKKVQLLGDFNNWDSGEALSMKLKKGEYSATLDLEVGKEYQFKYLIDNASWENDWAADDYVVSSIGAENSVVQTYK
ncbi:MAG: isoamylase early set domain-containing protein [Saprospiraceae bacterium]|nr:isoamylase early set domain-containing protein [Saprospiraceae bacterium]